MRRRDPTAAQLAQIERLALRVAKTRGRARHEAALVLADLVEEAGYPTPNRIATGRRGPPQRFRVYTLDVWGNEEDGYEINERFRHSDILVPQYEHVYNVSSYRDQIRRGLTSTPGSQPILRTIFTARTYSHDNVLRTLLDPVLVPNHSVEDMGGDDLEIVQRRDGKPVAHLEARR